MLFSHACDVPHTYRNAVWPWVWRARPAQPVPIAPHVSVYVSEVTYANKLNMCALCHTWQAGGSYFRNGKLNGKQLNAIYFGNFFLIEMDLSP